MKLLKITKCSDSMMWYASHIGQYVPYLGEGEDARGPFYWSREDAGYKNIVLRDDAVIVDNQQQEDIYTKRTLDQYLHAMLGRVSHVEAWWESRNKAFDNKRPIDVYHSSEQGRRDVARYILSFVQR
jgi:hypothetical protein